MQRAPKLIPGLGESSRNEGRGDVVGQQLGVRHLRESDLDRRLELLQRTNGYPFSR